MAEADFVESEMSQSKCKEFMMPRKVLDAIRFHLDPSEDALEHCQQAGFITSNQREQIVAKKWPLNRNDLLRHIVDMTWTTERLLSFVDFMECTQSPMLVKEVQQIIRKECPEEQKVETTVSSELPVGMEKLKDVDLDETTSQVVIMLLRERDNQLRGVRVDLATSREQTTNMTATNWLLRKELNSLGQMVNDLVRQVANDNDPPTDENGLESILKGVDTLTGRLKRAEEDIQLLEEERIRLTKVNSRLFAENIQCKEELETSEDRQQSLQTIFREEVTRLEERVGQDSFKLNTLNTHLEKLRAEKKPSKQEFNAIDYKPRAQEKQLASSRAIPNTVRESFPSEFSLVKSQKKNEKLLPNRHSLATSSMTVSDQAELPLSVMNIVNTKKPVTSLQEHAVKSKLSGARVSHDSVPRTNVNLSLNLDAGSRVTPKSMQNLRRRLLVNLESGLTGDAETSKVVLPSAASVPRRPPYAIPAEKRLLVSPGQSVVPLDLASYLPLIRKRSNQHWKLKTELMVWSSIHGLEVRSPLANSQK